MTEDKVGVLRQIIHLIVEEGITSPIQSISQPKDDRVVIEVQTDGVTDLEGIRSKFGANGLKVDGNHSNNRKSNLIKNQAWMIIQSDFY